MKSNFFLQMVLVVCVSLVAMDKKKDKHSIVQDCIIQADEVDKAFGLDGIHVPDAIDNIKKLVLNKGAAQWLALKKIQQTNLLFQKAIGVPSGCIATMPRENGIALFCDTEKRGDYNVDVSFFEKIHNEQNMKKHTWHLQLTPAEKEIKFNSLSPDSTRGVIATNSTVKVYDIDTASEIEKKNGRSIVPPYYSNTNMLCMAFLNKSSSRTNSLNIYDLRQQKPAYSAHIPAHFDFEHDLKKLALDSEKIIFCYNKRLCMVPLSMLGAFSNVSLITFDTPNANVEDMCLFDNHITLVTEDSTYTTRRLNFIDCTIENESVVIAGSNLEQDETVVLGSLSGNKYGFSMVVEEDGTYDFFLNDDSREWISLYRPVIASETIHKHVYDVGSAANLHELYKRLWVGIDDCLYYNTIASLKPTISPALYGHITFKKNKFRI